MTARSDILSPTAAAAAEPRQPSFMWLGAGLAALVAALLHLLLVHNPDDPARAFLGWVIGASFWLSVLIGMMFLLMIWYLFDAGWPIILRRQIEHALGAMPVLALIFAPLLLVVLFGPKELLPFEWMHPHAPLPGGHGTVGEDPLFLHKEPLLNTSFFVIRAVGIFAIFSVLAYYFRRWSFRMDVNGDHGNVHAARKLAAAGIPLCAISLTLFSIDWFKSLNYHWFSTMYGVWFFAGSMRAALAMTTLALFYQAGKDNGLRGVAKPAHFYYMGCIMLAFTVFWAYISFSQFFLIYSANIPEETFWYNIRELASTEAESLEGIFAGKNTWYLVSRGLIYLYFFLPFLYLLFYKNKFGSRLGFICFWILGLHLLDLYWNILPQTQAAPDTELGFTVRQFSVGISDILVFVGTGCLVYWSYLRSAGAHQPIPIRDPRILESIHAHE